MRHVWIKVETCSDSWMDEESVFIFIYTLAISISLVSKPSTTNRSLLLVVIVLPPTIALFVPYLLLFLFRLYRSILGGVYTRLDKDTIYPSR